MTNNVILPTVIIDIKSVNGNFVRCRALLDIGSQITIIKSDLVACLGLKRHYNETPLVGIGGIRNNDGNQIVKFYFKSEKSNQCLLSVTAVILKKPTSYLARKLGLPVGSNIKLADNGSGTGQVDVIFGCDILGHIINGEKIELGKGGPYALGTIFDFAVFGPAHSVESYNLDSSLGTSDLDSNHNDNNVGLTLIEAVEKFWRSEEPPCTVIKNPADIECETLFASTTTRGADGKYVVRLPLIPGHPRLGNSKEIALRRFLAVERRMARQPEYRAKYVEFMSEYLRLGHMAVSDFDINSNQEHYFLSHFGIFKKSGDMGKIRIVYNGSLETSPDGVSLNMCLYSGERLQSDISRIINTFRLPRFVFCTDIKMMFRQTWIHPDDRKYQLIFWRTSPDEPLRVYELTTNTYGLKSSPFVSIRCLHQLASDEESRYPRAAKLLRENSYVDDLNGGADTLEDALHLRDELVSLMDSAGYELRKWSSNEPNLLDGLPTDHLETLRSFDPDMDGSGLIKVLGVQWEPERDVFTYRINLPEVGTITRRSILSLTARLYDPLGWVCPVVFKIKLLLQTLLGSFNNSRKVEWDAPVPSEIIRQWEEILSDLPNLEMVSIPRSLKMVGSSRYTVHGFCDGSSVGFSAVVYLRSINTDGSVFVRLLMAKSRVAPLRTKHTIPKMELNGAALLTTLINHVVSTLDREIKLDGIFGWCDSTIVLAWLKTPPHILQVYEGNRVSQIIASKANITWRHVPSELNCADVASRGTTARELLHHPLWWEPQWLTDAPARWPGECADFPADMLPGLRLTAVNVATVDEDFDLMNRFSSFDKLINVTAYLLRFIRNCRMKCGHGGNHVSVSERKDATTRLIRLVQTRHYESEISAIREGKPIKNYLRRLNLFIDKDNLLRIGGRIGASELPYNARHPILLPGKDRFTELLVTHYHKVHCHVGANTLESILSWTYWIVAARRITRHVTFKCVSCYMSRPRPVQPYMADLPPDRVRGERSFIGTATDFGGPFYIKSSNLRNAKIQKCFLCIFICLSTKAVHLEVVSQLSVEAFVAALTRFTSRRGVPHVIRSDCGTNYTGTDKYLRDLYAFLRNSQTEIDRECVKHEIRWLFNAPSSPNFNGLVEAAIKSAKTHVKRVLGEARLTFEELATFFTKVEAVMNSRPLCPLSSDPSNLNILTPGHFLVNGPLVALPEYPFTEVNESRLSRFQRIQKITQHFWNRWKNEYLHTLQQRYKWTSHTEPPKVDDLVLIKEDNLASLNWKRGRIVKLLPGKDGVVRVVEVKTQNGVLLRPVSKLCRLPLRD